jgi:hypothetical protein
MDARIPRALGRLAHLMLTVTLSMSAAEFSALQQLPDGTRRDRLGMPANCAPALTAINTDPVNAGRLTVSVDCRSGQRVGAPASFVPPHRPRPGR